MRIDSATEFADYWRGVRGRTSRVVERDMYAENVSGRPSRYPGHGRELADGLAAVREYHDRTHAESLAIFSSLTAEQLAAKCATPAGTPITTWKWLRAMVEHEAHHRGQLYMMLGMRGVKVPSLYGMSEEEVKEKRGH